MKKKGQIWVETVLYTLIGIALIGVVLAFATPRINESRDNLLVEQTIESLNVLDEKINSVLVAPRNVRVVDYTMKRGELYINSTGDEIIHILRDISSPYSEPGVVINDGRVKVLTESGQKTNIVVLRLKYSNVDLKYDEQDEIIERKFGAAATPYTFSITSLSENEVSIKDTS